MEENQQNTEEIKTVNEELKPCDCPAPPYLKWLLVGLLIFLGSFCASYVLLDWHTKAMFLPPKHYDLYRTMQDDVKMANKIMKTEKIFTQNNSNIIHMEQTKDYYKIKIDLKPFDNNEENIQIATNEHILTISGRSVKKTEHNEQITRFQQSYMFGNDVKLEDMEKEVDGSNLFITIPIKKDK